jgi:signal transduction histidine kinase
MISKIDNAPEASRLQENRLFAGIPAELINDIGADVDLLRFDADDAIFSEGDPGDCLYLVVEGGVRISKIGRGGKQETLGFIQPGNFFGEMSLIDGQPRSANATAAEASVLGRIDAASFARILDNAPRDLHMNFLRSVVERLRGINSHFITELMRSERLSLVGTMANSIIHDLKNPIHALKMCTSLIEKRTEDPSIKGFTAIMEKSVESMTDMVQELLDFARGQSSLQQERKPVKAVLEELDTQLVRLVPENVHLIRDLHPSGEIMVDVRRFVRVLLNIIKNSVESMPSGGLLRLGLRVGDGRVLFTVSDTGCGIPAELQAKIFEPFVTHGKAQGTGLGMSIAKNVVEAHGGFIALQSAEGVGTMVEIVLPTL